MYHGMVSEPRYEYRFLKTCANRLPYLGQYLVDLAREVKAIVVSFNYRLLPYVDGSCLLSDAEDALLYLHSTSGFQTFLRMKVPTITINWNKVMVTGESAGGFLAAHTWLKSSVSLKAVYLRYPMLAQYQRKSQGYGGVPISNNCYEKMVQAAMDEIERIKRSGEPMPAESSLHPPINMPAANIFSSTDRWKDVFQHHDILQMLEHQEEPPCSHPKVFVVHGEKDAACAITNSARFSEDIGKKGWADGEVNLVAVPDVDHGFDYNLRPETKGCEWLKELLPRVREAWVGE
jgi:acetyl esterase/lipase